jgi:hypothetical protein
MKLDLSTWLFQRALISNTSLSSQRKTITAIEDTSGQKALEAQTKRLNDMQNALSQLRAMPSYKVSFKHAAAERAAMLKKQLDMLKQLMVGATPSQAKAIAAQVKAIAKELVSLASNLSSGGDSAAAQSPAATVTKVADGGTEGADAASTIAADTGQEASDATPATSGESTTAPTVSTETKAVSTEDAAHGDSGSTAATLIAASQTANTRMGVAAYAAQNSQNAQSPHSTSGNGGMEKEANDALRKALEEARNALRALVSMLKSKLGAANKDLQEATGKLADLDRLLIDAGLQNTDAPGGLARGGEVPETLDTTVSSADATSAVDTGMSVTEAEPASGISINVQA